MFTLGGLIASLSCGIVARRYCIGRKGCIQAAAALCVHGGLLLAASSTAPMLGFARLLQGFAAGISVVQVPLFLKELSPPDSGGALGVLNQIAVVLGIFAAQATGALCASGAWRRVPMASAVVGMLQLVTSYVAVESPGWLIAEGVALSDAKEQAAAIQHRLWGGAVYATLEPIDEARDEDVEPRSSLTDAAFIRGMRVVLVTQLAQQFSGVNAIMYYSTGILAALVPGMADTIGLLITIVNAVMTLPPIWLTPEHRVGRKHLLLFSAAGMSFFSFLLAYSLYNAHKVMGGVAILMVIASFSLGLGPIPWLILPELIPPQTASLGASIGLGVNWLANIVVAAGFQPLRSALNTYDHATGAAVFLLFGSINAASALGIMRMYRYAG